MFPLKRQKTFEEIFQFKEEKKHDSDFQPPATDEMKKLTDLMEKHNLTNSSLYKLYSLILKLNHCKTNN